MEKVAKNESQNKTYDDFIEAFWILYEKKDINKIRVREICEIAGYNRSTFYNHFIDVYDVLDQIENKILQEVIEMTSDGYSIWSREDSTKRYTELYERNSKYLKLLSNEEKGSHFSYKLIKVIDNVLGERVYFSSDNEESELVREYHINGSVAMIMKYFRGETNLPLDKIIDFALEVCKQGKWSIKGVDNMDKTDNFVD